MSGHSAERVRLLQEIQAIPCTAESFVRLGMKNHCIHCYCVEQLRLIDGADRES